MENELVFLVDLWCNFDPQGCSWQLWTKIFFDRAMKKTRRLFRTYRNLYYPVIWGLCMVILNHCKDPYWTTRIQWKVGLGFFVAQMTLIERVWLVISFAPSFYLDEDVLIRGPSISGPVLRWMGCHQKHDRQASQQTNIQTKQNKTKQNKTNKQTNKQPTKQTNKQTIVLL